MVQTRANVQQALNTLLAARSPRDRAAASDRLLMILNAHLSSPVDASEQPVRTDRVTKRTRLELGDVAAPVTHLTDEELEELNRILPWGAMTVDQRGRGVGQVWSSEKRGLPLSLIHI